MFRKHGKTPSKSVDAPKPEPSGARTEEDVFAEADGISENLTSEAAAARRREQQDLHRALQTGTAGAGERIVMRQRDPFATSSVEPSESDEAGSAERRCALPDDKRSEWAGFQRQVTGWQKQLEAREQIEVLDSDKERRLADASVQYAILREQYDEITRIEEGLEDIYALMLTTQELVEEQQSEINRIQREVATAIEETKVGAKNVEDAARLQKELYSKRRKLMACLAATSLLIGAVLTGGIGPVAAAVIGGGGWVVHKLTHRK